MIRKNQAERILSMTSGGLLVFVHYIGEGCLSKKFCNPLRKDTHPSCRLYHNVDSLNVERYYFTDFANKDYRGDCFWYVAKLCGFSLTSDFGKILQTIDKDLCLGVFDETPLASNRAQDLSRRVQQRFQTMERSSIQSYSLRTKVFTQKELDYWGVYGITPETLGKYNVQSVETCTFVKRDGTDFSIWGSESLPVFGYCFGKGKGYKFYRPGAKNRFLYAGSLPHPYVFGMEQLPATGDVLFITGGEKDVLSLASHGFNAIAFNSETAKLSEDMLKSLTGRFVHVVLLYDSDETGIQESMARVEEHKGTFNLQRLQLPLAGTKQEKDVSDYFRLGNSAEKLQQLLNDCIKK